MNKDPRPLEKKHTTAQTTASLTYTLVRLGHKPFTEMLFVKSAPIEFSALLSATQPNALKPSCDVRSSQIYDFSLDDQENVKQEHEKEMEKEEIREATEESNDLLGQSTPVAKLFHYFWKLPNPQVSDIYTKAPGLL